MRRLNPPITMKNTKHTKHTKQTKKRKYNRRVSPYSGPTTIAQSVRNFHSQSRSADQWLVTICQHVAINRLNRMQIADLLYDECVIRKGGGVMMSKDEAWTCAGRIHRLSKDEHALPDIKYGFQPFAKRMTITKRPF